MWPFLRSLRLVQVGLNNVRLAWPLGSILTHEIHYSFFDVVNIKVFYAPFILEKFPEILLTLVIGS
jgi:hypothetical protein